ncbi:uncharacterized protein DUF664 [Algoriphagus boseongensis]|uniref:Uncharacterized protein DUF664 n=1 Tax=Algoriphagus boseongensis TaxID=1442587 RepID=A0A4R6T5Q9_9BACT|nr:DinB family protein [Algoriphagus boseongensis]TDQ16649.1 uncharacterized protein DUF664 [Algoriphagus boseongensis]
MKENKSNSRRDFLKSSTLLTSATLGMASIPLVTSASPLRADNRENVIGPRDGYSPQLGTLVSMLTWMRNVILMPVMDLDTEQLDYLLDEQSNSIGSMLLHLAATERFYQVHTLEGKAWGDWSKKDKDRFEVAMNLGEDARQKIKGNSLDFYLSTLEEVREISLTEFKKRDDEWLMKVDESWPWGPTNNYCKWFHVCEHESNHNGQFKYIRGRLPEQ